MLSAEGKKKIYILLTVLFIINMLVFYIIFREAQNVLTVAFLDVGQGDAIYIETPKGYQVLIDAGATKAVESQLSKLIPAYDRTIDFVIATHPDADHIGGLPSIFNHYVIDNFITSDVIHDTALNKELKRLIELEGSKNIFALRGQKIIFGDGVELEILYPTIAMQDSEPNTASVIARLSYGRTSFLFTGDAPKTVERYLTSLYGAYIDSDVLKVGHHGSKTSSDETFITNVSPALAIISAGLNNSYGHPHESVLHTLNAFDTNILATYDVGTIVLISDGKHIVIK